MPTFRFHIGNDFEPVKKLMGADKNGLFNIVGEILNYIKSKNTETNDQSQTKEVKKNTDMDVPFLYNPIPEHKFS